MTNSAEAAAHWAKFIAECPEFVAGEAPLAQFNAGKITRLCECGCNSFNMVLEEGRQTAPIVPPSGRGHAVFLAEFPTKQPPGASLEFIVYADANGDFDGLDVHLNGNTEPIPEKLVVSEAPYHAYGILARRGRPCSRADLSEKQRRPPTSTPAIMKYLTVVFLFVATLAAAPSVHSADRKGSMSHVEERSESGSPIYRHKPRSPEWTAPRHSGKNLEEVEAHVEKYIGKVESVYHEVLSDLVHLDVLIVPATAERPYHVLVTSGVSDEPMNVPEGMQKFRRVELLIALPRDWPLDQESLKNEANYWPVRWLKTIGRLPHEYKTWIGWGHSIPNGDPPEPIANTGFVGAMLTPPYSLPKDFFQFRTKSGDTISFYVLTPLYKEEMDLKLKKGADTLEERFEKRGIGFVLDTKRANVAKAKGWFGK